MLRRHGALMIAKWCVISVYGLIRISYHFYRRNNSSLFISNWKTKSFPIFNSGAENRSQMHISSLSTDWLRYLNTNNCNLEIDQNVMLQSEKLSWKPLSTLIFSLEENRCEIDQHPLIKDVWLISLRIVYILWIYILWKYYIAI